MTTSFITRADDALEFNLSPSERMAFLAAGDADMPDVMHATFAPGDGPPLHSHPWASWDVVVRGRILYRLGDDDHELGPGDFVYTAPNTPHTFMGIGDETTEIVGFNWPGGFHHLYAELERVLAADDPDMDALSGAADQHGAALLGPPLAVLTGRVSS